IIVRSRNRGRYMAEALSVRLGRVEREWEPGVAGAMLIFADDSPAPTPQGSGPITISGIFRTSDPFDFSFRERGMVCGNRPKSFSPSRQFDTRANHRPHDCHGDH